MVKPPQKPQMPKWKAWKTNPNLQNKWKKWQSSSDEENEWKPKKRMQTKWKKNDKNGWSSRDNKSKQRNEVLNKKGSWVSKWEPLVEKMIDAWSPDQESAGWEDQQDENTNEVERSWKQHGERQMGYDEQGRHMGYGHKGDKEWLGWSPRKMPRQYEMMNSHLMKSPSWWERYTAEIKNDFDRWKDKHFPKKMKQRLREDVKQRYWRKASVRQPRKPWRTRHTWPKPLQWQTRDTHWKGELRSYQDSPQPRKAWVQRTAKPWTGHPRKSNKPHMWPQPTREPTMQEQNVIWTRRYKDRHHAVENNAWNANMHTDSGMRFKKVVGGFTTVPPPSYGRWNIGNKRPTQNRNNHMIIII